MEIDLIATYKPQPWPYEYVQNSSRFVCIHSRDTVFRYYRYWIPETGKRIYEVIKFGPTVDRAEFENMRKLYDANLPVPRPLKFWPCETLSRAHHKPWHAIVMEEVEGENLCGLWSSMTESEKLSIIGEVGYFIRKMTLQPVDRRDGAEKRGRYGYSFDSDDTDAVRENLVRTLPYRSTLNPRSEISSFIDAFRFFHQEAENHTELMQDFLGHLQNLLPPAGYWRSEDDRCATYRVLEHLLLNLMPSTDMEPVLTHGSLAAKNILMKDGKLAAVLDWSTAGVWPAY